MTEILAGALPQKIFDSRDPATSIRCSADNPEGCAKFYYQIRSNMCHRGKAGFQDAELARQALSTLTALTEATLRGMRSAAPIRPRTAEQR